MSPYVIPGLKKHVTISKATRLSDALIIDAIIDYREQTREKVFGSSRKQNLVHTRRLIFWFLKRMTSLSLVQIGKSVGGRDHTTVIYSIQTLEDLMQTEPDIRREVDYLNHLLLQ